MNFKMIIQEYLWVVLMFAFLSLGGRIYFTLQPIGLTLIFGGLMMILALENSDMIHAVTEQDISTKWYRTFFVHFQSQKSIARFIYLYHFYLYGFVIIIGAVLLILGEEFMIQFSQSINVILLFFFGLAAMTIFIRRIIVGAKYEH